MATESTIKPAKKKAKKLAAKIIGLVLLTGKNTDSENPNRVGLSFRPQDDQQMIIEVATSLELADTLQVDKIYELKFVKGATEGVPGAFKIGHLNEVQHGLDWYEEKFVAKGDVSKHEVEGHIHMLVLPEQEEFFYEGKSYTLSFTEVVESEE